MNLVVNRLAFNIDLIVIGSNFHIFFLDSANYYIRYFRSSSVDSLILLYFIFYSIYTISTGNEIFAIYT